MRIELDVSGLPPCEPLENIVAALPRLSAGDWLHVHHRQEPHPLYRLLEQGGYAWRTQTGGHAGFEIFIWRHGDLAAEQGAAEV